MLGLGLSGALYAPSLAADGSTLYLAQLDGEVESIYEARRSGPGASFEPASSVTEVNTAGNNGTPHLSSDGQLLYFHSTRAGGLGNRDLWFALRSKTTNRFGFPSAITSVNSSSLDHRPWTTADQLTLFLVSARPGGLGGSDLWFSTRANATSPFPEPINLTSLNTSDLEEGFSLSRDGLTAIFSSDRPGGSGDLDLWLTTREAADADFGPPANLSALNSEASDVDGSLSADGRELFFSSGRSGSHQIYRATRECR